MDTTWFLELPQAANTFDFDSLMDVIITYDYTALINLDLRDRGASLLGHMGIWTFTLQDVASPADSLLQQLRNRLADNVLVAVSRHTVLFPERIVRAASSPSDEATS